MPRRNEDGFHNSHERRMREWGYRDPASWNPLLSANRSSEYGTLKTTGESIVRQHRTENRIHSDQIPLPPPLLKGDKRGIMRRFIEAIDWSVALDYACWAAVVVCLIYIGIFVIAPFGIKIIWE